MVVFAGIVWYSSVNLTDLRSRESDVVAPAGTPQSISEPQQTSANGWTDYVSEQNNFSISYPEQFTITEREQGTTQFIFVGSTQAMDAEFFDGISFIFSSHNLAGNLTQSVQFEHSEVSAGGAIDEAGAIEPISLAGYQGYTFEVTGLGTYRYYFLENGDQYLKIAALVADPGAGGYQDLADEMLSTLKLQ